MNQPPEPPTAAEIDRFLADFDQRCLAFGRACDSYMRDELGIGDITRQLSEATADAEQFFSEQSFYMNMEQLQRYGSIQKVFDNLTFELFETEIERNRKVIHDALIHGDYFIIKLTYNSIKSSIYMMYAKHKIKVEQEARLAALEIESEATQAMIKVLKALESVLTPGAQPGDERILKAVDIYASYFRQAGEIVTRAACDERLFRLFEAHMDELARHATGGEALTRYVEAICDRLGQLGPTAAQAQLLAIWRQLPAERQPQPQHLAPEPPPAPSLLQRHLDQLETLLRPETEPEYSRIQLSLRQYVETFRPRPEDAEVVAGDKRLFSLLEEHVDWLDTQGFYQQPERGAQHLNACCDILEPIAGTSLQQQMLAVWRAIRASVYLSYADQQIRSQQDQQLAAFERELEANQLLMRELKALEVQIGARERDLLAIQQALQAYSAAQQRHPDAPTRSLCDNRVFSLFEAHLDAVLGEEANHQLAVLAAHVRTCCSELDKLASEPLHQQLLGVWRKLLQDKIHAYQRQPRRVPPRPPAAVTPPAAGLPPAPGVAEQAVAELKEQLRLASLADPDFAAIETALAQCCGLTGTGGFLSRETLFGWIESHIDGLYDMRFFGARVEGMRHLYRCCDLLQGLGPTPVQAEVLAVWRALPPP